MNKEQANDLLEAKNMIDKALSILARGPLSFWLEQLVGGHNWAIDNCAPVKPGDIAVLTKDIEYGRRSHFMKKGTLCKIVDVMLDEKGFYCSVSFESESWYSSIDDRYVPSPNNNTYRLRATDMVRVP
jgi:hypothetical protein